MLQPRLKEKILVAAAPGHSPEGNKKRADLVPHSPMDSPHVGSFVAMVANYLLSVNILFNVFSHRRIIWIEFLQREFQPVKTRRFA